MQHSLQLLRLLLLQRRPQRKLRWQQRHLPFRSHVRCFQVLLRWMLLLLSPLVQAWVQMCRKYKWAVDSSAPLKVFSLRAIMFCLICSKLLLAQIKFALEWVVR
mmetsp:Transcript_74001/g.164418  ORF Transcript_74001/g.164418 Transcript_74001/m.164418 type:complete len:104 (-) Transcript_74001:640-951(-)